MARTSARTVGDLRSIPGVGPSIALDLAELGYRRAGDLRGESPEAMYDALCVRRGVRQDRCLLYVFRCAVYYASHAKHDPALLKWWNWKDANPAAAGPRPAVVRRRGGVTTP